MAGVSLSSASSSSLYADKSSCFPVPTRKTASPLYYYYYSTSTVMSASIHRLGLGGYKWSSKSSSSSVGGQEEEEEANPNYAALVQTALEQGIRTLEAGQEGGDEALARVLRQVLLQNDNDDDNDDDDDDHGKKLVRNKQPIHCLWRVGYRVVIPPDANDSADAELQNLFFAKDVPVVEDSSHDNDNSNAQKKTSKRRIFHNIGADYLEYQLLSNSAPLVKLQRDFPDRIQVSVLLQNPEVQREGIAESGNDDDDDDDELLRQRLQEAFGALQKHVDNGKITSFGVVSNGLCLPPQHPLHLSWKDHVMEAARRAQIEFSSSSNQQHQHQQQPLAMNIIQLPMNLLETTGLDIARQIQDYVTKSSSTTSTADDEKAPLSFLKNLQIYAMRPLTCYPDRGTGTGHPFVLADHRLPATMQKSLQWTNEMTAPPEAYQVALTSTMAHFDAEEILQTKLSGERALTGQERETLDGCKLMQSLLHDVDAGLEKVRSFAAHEEHVMTRIIPLIHDTFESYDDETAAILKSFFGAYSLAVRYWIARNTRQLLTTGDEKDSNSPTYPDLPQTTRLQEYALQFLLKESQVVDKIIVGASDPEQVIDTAEIVKEYDAQD